MPQIESEAERIFNAARAIGAQGERAGYLAGACGADAALRARVDALLSAHEQAGEFLTRPAHVAATTEQPGQKIGRYKLLQLIGEGGFGAVFMAEQETPVARKVALKIIKLGMDTRQVVARFEQERQALAMMDHPNIARVLDAGATETGRPFFVMDLVKGAPIAEYCDKNNLAIEERLELFAQVCKAVQHAHSKGIIHRDLKPSNILVGTQDGRPQAKVIDFGIAKATSAKLTDKTLFTEHQQVIGTLQYMSPEQAEGSLDIDTRTDVYSLGVLLYELLTGSTPFDKKTIGDALYGEIRRMIREVEPPKPSTRISDSQEALASIAAHRRVEPKRLGTLIRGELDWIVMRCLEKDRTRRYETANGLARDIERHMHDEAVEACPQSAGYRLRKFGRKNKKLLATAAAFTVLLTSGVVVSLWEAVRAKSAEARANTERESAQANFALARDAVDSYLAAITDDPDLQRQDFTHLRKRLLETALPFYQDLVKQKPGDMHQEIENGRAYWRLGSVRGLTGDLHEALVDFQQAESVFARLTEAPGGAVHRGRLAAAQFSTGWALKSLGQHAEAEAKLRQSLGNWQQFAAESPEDRTARPAIAMLHVKLGVVLRESGHAPEAEVEHRLGCDQLRELAAQSPTDSALQAQLAEACPMLAQCLCLLGQTSDALPLVTEATAIRARLLEAAPDEPQLQDDLATAKGALASVLEDLHHDSEAEAMFRQAIDLEAQLAKRFPTVPYHRYAVAANSSNLGRLLIRTLQYDDAAQAYLTAIHLSDDLARDYPNLPDYLQLNASAHQNFGLVLQCQNKFSEAEAQYELAIVVGRRLTVAFPNETNHKLFFIQALNNIGTLQEAQKNYAGAETSYRESIALNRDLVSMQGREPEPRNHLSGTLRNLGRLLSGDANRRDESTSLSREGIALGEQLVKEFPASPVYRSDLAASCNGFGATLRSRGANVDAEAQFRRAVELLSELARDFPQDHGGPILLAGTYGNLGSLLYDEARTAEALGLLDKSIDCLSKELVNAPTDAGVRRFLRNNYCKRAYVRSSLNQHAQAAEDWHHSLELSEPPIDRKARLGEVVERARLDGQHDRALQLADALAAEKGIDTETLYGMACICAETARDATLNESYAPMAVSLLDHAVMLGYTNADSLSTDQSFDRIRERADFRAVVREATRKVEQAAANHRP